MVNHEKHIRECIDLAIEAAKKGNHPFGAVLVHNGEIIMRAENTVNTDHNSTRHAELNLVVKSQNELPANIIAESTLYTSTAPCLICTGTIWSAGITRIVYCVSYQGFARWLKSDFRYLPCEDIYRLLDTPAEIYGPILEPEGLKAYEYWRKG
jgi:tRNA(Arg) A34 adenosine deaminase TadA